MTKEQYAAFVNALDELCRKHGIYIWGCGCCESPRLEPIPEGEKDGGYYCNYFGGDGVDRIEWYSKELLSKHGGDAVREW